MNYLNVRRSLLTTRLARRKKEHIKKRAKFWADSTMQSRRLAATTRNIMGHVKNMCSWIERQVGINGAFLSHDDCGITSPKIDAFFWKCVLSLRKLKII